MKAITIHGLEDPLWALLKERARADGASLNATIKRLLEQGLGVKRDLQQPHRSEFEEFCGMWSKEQAEEFQNAVADDETIDAKDWT